MDEFQVLVGRWPHHVGEVGPGEAHLDDIGLAKTQLLLNVVHHLRRGGGREGQHRDIGLEAAQVGYAKIGRPEVVAPLRDAMGLIHRDEAHVDAVELVLEERGGKPLGRHIEQFGVAEDAVVERLHDLALRHSAIHSCGDDAPLAQMGHLVLHQGDEGRDDDAHALLGQGRHLEGDALAATRGHEAERVAPGTNALDDLALDAAEVWIMPIVMKNLLIVGHSSLGLMSSICNCTALRLKTFSSMV